MCKYLRSTRLSYSAWHFSTVLPDGFEYLPLTFPKKEPCKISATAGSKRGSEAVMCKYSRITRLSNSGFLAFYLGLPDSFAYLLLAFLKKNLVKFCATAGSKQGSEAVASIFLK